MGNVGFKAAKREGYEEVESAYNVEVVAFADRVAQTIITKLGLSDSPRNTITEGKIVNGIASAFLVFYRDKRREGEYATLCEKALDTDDSFSFCSIVINEFHGKFSSKVESQSPISRKALEFLITESLDIFCKEQELQAPHHSALAIMGFIGSSKLLQDYIGRLGGPEEVERLLAQDEQLETSVGGDGVSGERFAGLGGKGVS